MDNSQCKVFFIGKEEHAGKCELYQEGCTIEIFSHSWTCYTAGQITYPSTDPNTCTHLALYNGDASIRSACAAITDYLIEILHSISNYHYRSLNQ